MAAALSAHQSPFELNSQGSLQWHGQHVNKVSIRAIITSTTKAASLARSRDCSECILSCRTDSVYRLARCSSAALNCSLGTACGMLDRLQAFVRSAQHKKLKGAHADSQTELAMSHCLALCASVSFAAAVSIISRANA